MPRPSPGWSWPCMAVFLLSACQPSAPVTPCDCPEIAPPRQAAAGARQEQSLREVITARRSIRRYTDGPVGREDVEAVVWAAQGVTLPPDEADRVDGRGLRAAPSAGATYPLETYLLANRVDGMVPGLYHYRPESDELVPTGLVGDFARPLADASLRQRVVATAAAVVVFAAELSRTERRYGERAERYVMMELGHAGQNAHLMATARDLGACAIGAFDTADVSRLLELPTTHQPYYMLTLGRPRAGESALR